MKSMKKYSSIWNRLERLTPKESAEHVEYVAVWGDEDDNGPYIAKWTGNQEKRSGYIQWTENQGE